MSDVVAYCEKCCASNSGGIGSGSVACCAIATTPDDGAAGVAVDSSVSVSFSAPVIADSANPDTLALEPAVAGRYAQGDTEFTVVFTPDSPLAAAQQYIVRINGIQVAEGGEVIPHTFVFATA